MVIEKIVEGRFVDLKSVTEEDALFTLEIRQIKKNENFIPKLDISLEQQKRWIKKSRNANNDYFFVVWSKDGQRIGTIGLYDIVGDTAEAGRIVMTGNPLQSIEAQFLVFDFAFTHLKLASTHSFIFAENSSALKFSSLFGGSISQPEKNEKGEMICKSIKTKESFEEVRPKLERMLYGVRK